MRIEEHYVIGQLLPLTAASVQLKTAIYKLTSPSILKRQWERSVIGMKLNDYVYVKFFDLLDQI